ncbi:MAG: hypothetical protein N3D85_00445 [Candidatus Bathyarchaeota archaeon]|nr:hypothetical protein [Candidatus Bathyarchaeota archaeon]
MYDELYTAWRVEIEYRQLSSLPSDFYVRVAHYLKKLREYQLSEKKSVEEKLMEHELLNVQRMVEELLQVRYQKIMKSLVAGDRVPLESLTAEETSLYNGVLPSAVTYNKFMQSLLGGQVSKIEAGSPVHKRVTLRFLKQVPQIIGADMKSYGPFMVEDVASIPIENAKILVKQGLAKQIEL